jgi:hypothetical protein
MSVAGGELPLGLTLAYTPDGNTAEITGTPTQTGAFEFAIIARCYGTNVSGQVGEQPYELSVK